MKNFCRLLFIALLAHVRADEHPCAPLAAYIGMEGVPQENPYKNLVIEYKDFTKDPHVTREMFIAWATLDKTFDKYPEFCTASSYGSNCGGIFFQRKIINSESLFDENGNAKVDGKGVPIARLRTNFYAQNKLKSTQNLTGYTMDIQLVSSKYYIFETVPGTLKAFKQGVKEPVTIPDEVKKIVTSQFALYHGEKNFNVYITCDAKYVWVSVRDTVLAGNVRGEVENLLLKLEKINSKPFTNRKSVKDIPEEYHSIWSQSFSQEIPVLDDTPVKKNE